MIHKYKIRCRKLSHSFQSQFLTLLSDSKKYFDEGFRVGRYGATNNGAWHMDSEDLAAMDHVMCQTLRETALYKRLSDVDAASAVLREVCMEGCRRGLAQYQREELKRLPAGQEAKRDLYASQVDLRFDLAETAFEQYWNDKWGDPKEE